MNSIDEIAISPLGIVSLRIKCGETVYRTTIRPNENWEKKLSEIDASMQSAGLGPLPYVMRPEITPEQLTAFERAASENSPVKRRKFLGLF